jgi:hypothetical protein
VANTKAQLRRGTTKAQAGAQQIAESVTTTAQAAAQTAAQRATQRAQVAAEQAQLVARQAASEVNSRVRAGTLSARGWVAPRLESAADYTTSTVAPAVSDAVVKNLAPRVSGALRSTARQVSPPKARKSSLRATLAWSSLVATVLAAAGAAGALAWRRYRAAMAADSEPDAVADRAADAVADRAADAEPTTASGTTASSAKPGKTGNGSTAPDDSEASKASPRPASSAW